MYNGDETKPVLYYYGADGQPAAVSDALSGRLTRYVYDLSGRLAEKREYTGHTLPATRLVSSVRYTYSETTGQPIAAAYTSYAADGYRSVGGKTRNRWSVDSLGCRNDTGYNSVDSKWQTIL